MYHINSILIFGLLFMPFHHFQKHRQISFLCISIPIRIHLQPPRQTIRHHDVRIHNLLRVFYLIIILYDKFSLFKIRHNITRKSWFFEVMKELVRFCQILVQFQILYYWLKVLDQSWFWAWFHLFEHLAMTIFNSLDFIVNWRYLVQKYIYFIWKLLTDLLLRIF